MAWKLGFVALVLASGIASPAKGDSGVNLVINGDFESGNTDFYSEYIYSPGYLWPEGTYDVLSDPAHAHGLAVSFGDHTSGAGLMMAVNGENQIAGLTVWSQVVPVAPHRDYLLSAWVATWSDYPPAELQFLVNDVLVGSFTAPVSPGIWEEFSATWSSGSNTTATIRIVDSNMDASGNDFTLDDLSLADSNCGNGILDAGEECDDGNTDSCDGCSEICQNEVGHVCGDGILNPDCEECDDGNNDDGDGCDSNCTITRCGNGIVTDGEECDDGNAVDGDGCDSNCTFTACGNGIVTDGEECDDGNNDDGDGCSADCIIEFCGDGITQAGLGEECDDGNVVSCDGCSEICETEVGYICGDGILNTDCEECDDGNNVDGDGCAADCTIEQGGWTTAEEKAKLLASDGDVGDQFGVSVALDGDTVIVGARGDNGGVFMSCDCCNQAPVGITGCPSCAPCEATVCDLDPYCCVVLWDSICDIEAQQLCTCCPDQDPGYCAPGAAAAYVFTRTGGVWSEQAKLLASDGEEGDQFGVSVALDGDTAIIGASRADNQGVPSGSAYVFTRTGGVWTQQAKLLAPGGEYGDSFGSSVALDGDTAVIGASGDNDNGLSSGSAYVFTRTGGVWSEQAKLLASDGSSGDIFGHSVALDGGTAVISALWEDDNGSQSGSAYVFTQTAGVWTEQTKLLASDGDAWNFFGSSVALDGDTAVIGALQGESNGSFPGSAYVFTRTAGVWTEQAKLLASDGEEGDQFGVSVALDGDTAVIGAWEDDDNGNDAGSAHLFTRTGDVWTEQTKMLASDGQAGDQFGASVALDGDTAVTGAYLDDDNSWSSGSVYVFRLLPCGDGILNLGEECDDGNNVSCDGCSDFCEIEVGYVCGDGILNTDCEECDDGNTDPGDGCRADCTLEICGDGILDPQEGCDDGNNTPCDGCSSDCVIEEGYVCGDGILNTDCGEECDDGDVLPCDGCSDFCEIEIGGVCGDGILNTDCEECDDGNLMDGDGCAADCTLEQDVPATTYRGMVVVALLLLVASTTYLLRRRANH
jgi:cysteine-rich repeat protein